MGVKQSKRSVDITEVATKGEIEGFGNEGKVEKIIDGVVEKVAANGHVEGDLQNGMESLQNGVEAMQNGEAAAAATEKITEKKDVDDLPIEGTVNGQVENGEVNGGTEKVEEIKKTDEKKKKDKKDKLIKKKFSFRNFSFSKKDKSKPPKEEKSPEKVDETAAEEVLQITPEKEKIESPLKGQPVESPIVAECTKLEVENENTVSVMTNAVGEKIKLEMDMSSSGKAADLSSKVSGGSEDLPPPLPASPPPSEPIEGKLTSAMDKLDLSEPSSENPSGEINEVASSISSILAEKMETMTDVIKNAEQIAMETGKQIEEKATNLLKTVEERAEESMRTAGEFISQKTDEIQEMCQNELGVELENKETKEEVAVDEAKNLEGLPVEISSLGSLSPKTEEATEKHEEGAGESLADIPKDLTDEVTAAAIEASNPDSLEISETILPPPVLEAVTGK